MLTDFSNITDYIPQAPPFLMIDRCIVHSIEKFEGFYSVDPSNPLVDEGIPSHSLIIEFFAQTCAAGFGYLTRDQEVEPGFIGAISKLKVHKDVNCNDQLRSIVDVKTRFENIQLIEGKIFKGDDLVLECKMKIVEP